MKYELESKHGGFSAWANFHQSKRYHPGEKIHFEIVNQWDETLFELDYLVHIDGLYGVKAELFGTAFVQVEIIQGANTKILSLLAGLEV